MFDSIVFRNQRNFRADSPIDMIALYEALLFYGSVTVIANKAILRQLVMTFGHDALLELVDEEHLRIEYLNSNAAIQTKNSGTPYEIHSPIFLSSPVLDLDNVAYELFQESTGKQGKGRRLATRFLRNVIEADFGQNLVQELVDDLADTDYVSDAVRCLLQKYTPEYPNIIDTEFHVNKTAAGLVVNSNIDFEQLNQIYHTRIPATHSSLSPAYLLSNMFNTRSDIHFASTHNSEIATDPASSAIMDIKYSDLLKRRSSSMATLSSFESFVDVEIQAFGEALMSGARSHEEFIALLSKARKMREWLKDKEPDIDIIKEYHRAVTAKSWVEKFPVKTTRWTIFSGIGMALDAAGAGGVGTAAGLGISVIDSFLLDKLIKGWKPDRFVSDLKEFSKKED